MPMREGAVRVTVSAAVVLTLKSLTGRLFPKSCLHIDQAALYSTHNFQETKLNSLELSLLSSPHTSLYCTQEGKHQTVDSSTPEDGFNTTYFEPMYSFYGPHFWGPERGEVGYNPRPDLGCCEKIDASLQHFSLSAASSFSFAVNLVCLNGDIAFHFNPRFNEGRVVVCNTKEKGRWGSEERTFNMPFQPGVYFEMIVHVRSHCYQVSLNGNHFLEYRHRLPFHLVQNLQINGDLSVNCITFSGNNVPPPYAPPAYNVITPTIASGMFSQPFFAPPMNSRRKSKTAQGYGGVILANPAVPLHVAIPGNFTQSRKITIVGNVPFLANRFHVNLKNSMTGNIALHINPRFKEGVLVRNTQIHGSWGSEERHIAAMPLSPGCAFHMEIINLQHNYRVSINGFAVFDYTHRIPPGQVDQLEIAGDVTLSSVQY